MSTLKVDALQDTSGNGFYPARAWGTFTGTAATPVMNGAGNFSSSITDSGTGLYSVTFSNALADVHYAVTLGWSKNRQQYVYLGYARNV